MSPQTNIFLLSWGYIIICFDADSKIENLNNFSLPTKYNDVWKKNDEYFMDNLCNL